MMQLKWTSWLLTLLFSFIIQSTLASQAVPWREQDDYPKDHDHFTLYVTREIVPMVGEKALIDGCGKNGRPYKYRGESHVQALHEALRGVTEELWVGAIATTTPWMWANGGYLYQLMGFTSSVPDYQTFRIPGNNVFLCALECDNVPYVLLQGNNCGCMKNSPDLLPTSGQVPILSKTLRLRCPSTYDQICGTVSTFSVYRNTLPDSVRWANLVEQQRYYGRNAFLYKQHISLDKPLQLMAEANWTAKMGYICNGSSLETPHVFHGKHIWAEHSPDKRETWRNARNVCMRDGRQLLTLLHEDDACVPDLEKELEVGQGYWVALSRLNVSLWLDGTPMRESATYHQHGQAGCLAMSLKDGEPTFTFESCTGIQLQVLCEKDTKIHMETFTHDESGNHMATGRTDGASDAYTRTVSALVAVLVTLSVLSLVLIVCLCNRNRFLPPSRKTKPLTGRPMNHRNSAIKQAEAYPPIEVSIVDKESACPLGTDLPRPHARTDVQTSNTFSPDSLGYAVVAKGRQTRLPPVGSDDTSTISQTSKSTDYTEVCVAAESSPDVNRLAHVTTGTVHSTDGCMNKGVKKTRDNHQTHGNVHTIRPAVLRAAESKEKISIAGSEDTTYSVLSYRRAIQKAWVGLKRTAAYAHVIVRRPKKDESDDTTHTQSGDVGAYDVTQPIAQRVRCIDNVYDHTELPVQVNEVNTSSGLDRPSQKKRTHDESIV